MRMGHTTNADHPCGGHCPQATPRQQLLHLLQAPLSELKPPGLAPGQLEGLRSLPEAKRLKLAYAFQAPESVTGRELAAALGSVSLSVEMLAALGRYVAKNPGVTLMALRFAAAVTVLDLSSPHGLPPGNEFEIFLTPTVLHLEGAAMLSIWRARSAGKSEELLGRVAGMVLELWELAARLERWPGKSAAELSHRLGRLSGKPEEILRQVAPFHAGDELAQRLTAWRSEARAAGTGK